MATLVDASKRGALVTVMTVGSSSGGVAGSSLGSSLPKSGLFTKAWLGICVSFGSGLAIVASKRTVKLAPAGTSPTGHWISSGVTRIPPSRGLTLVRSAGSIGSRTTTAVAASEPVFVASIV